MTLTGLICYYAVSCWILTEVLKDSVCYLYFLKKNEYLRQTKSLGPDYVAIKWCSENLNPGLPES